MSQDPNKNDDNNDKKKEDIIKTTPDNSKKPKLNTSEEGKGHNQDEGERPSA
jgi:hypothetical protein